MAETLISIITATFNATNILPRLLASLASQSFRNFNVIIQDGASTDGTVAVAGSFKNSVPEMIIKSIPDTGIYDAWNKALDNAGDRLGEWVLFLGADDSLAGPQVLAVVGKYLCSMPPDVNFVSTEICWVSGESIVRQSHFTQLPDSFDRLWEGMTVPFPGLFIRRSLFAQMHFDAAFKIAGDYDLLVRAWRNPDALITLPILSTRFSLGGCSTKFSHGFRNIAEKFAVRKKYFPHKYNYHDFIFAHLVFGASGPKEKLRKILMRSYVGQCLIRLYKLVKISVVKMFA